MLKGGKRTKHSGVQTGWVFGQPVHVVPDMFKEVPPEFVKSDIARAYALGLFKHNTKFEGKFTGYLCLSEDPEDQEKRHQWLEDCTIIREMIKWTIPPGKKYWVHWRPETKVMTGFANRHARALHTPCTCPPHHWMLSRTVWRRALCAQDQEQPATGSLHADFEHPGRAVHGMSFEEKHLNNKVVFVRKDGLQEELPLNASDSYLAGNAVLCESSGIKHQREGYGISIVGLNQQAFHNVVAMPVRKVVREACVLARTTQLLHPHSTRLSLTPNHSIDGRPVQ